MKKFLLFFLILFTATAYSQTKVSGTVTDESNGPVAGANIFLKGKIAGTTSDAKGNFELHTAQPTPFTIVVSIVGFQKQELEVTNAASNLAVKLLASSEVMDEVVVSASRVEESILQSPVSIEKMDLRDIQQTPSVTFYDALENLKGVEMVTSGLTFKQINTRGFNHTGNSRFLQLVDGVDNQTPGLGFSVGNMFGSSDLDMNTRGSFCTLRTSCLQRCTDDAYERSISIPGIKCAGKNRCQPHW